MNINAPAYHGHFPGNAIIIVLNEFIKRIMSKKLRSCFVKLF